MAETHLGSMACPCPNPGTTISSKSRPAVLRRLVDEEDQSADAKYSILFGLPCKSCCLRDVEVKLNLDLIKMTNTTLIRKLLPYKFYLENNGRRELLEQLFGDLSREQQGVRTGIMIRSQIFLLGNPQATKADKFS